MEKETRAMSFEVEAKNQLQANSVWDEQTDQLNCKNLCEKFEDAVRIGDIQYQLEILEQVFYRRQAIRNAMGGPELSRTQFLANVNNTLISKGE